MIHAFCQKVFGLFGGALGPVLGINQKMCNANSDLTRKTKKRRKNIYMCIYIQYMYMYLCICVCIGVQQCPYKSTTVYHTEPNNTALYRTEPKGPVLNEPNFIKIYFLTEFATY